MKKNIKFVDAQQMHRLHPDTFEAPTAEDLGTLQQGDFVKICAYQERFWAEVIAIDGKTVTARIDNELLTEKLHYNDVISFESRHVYDILKKEIKNEKSLEAAKAQLPQKKTNKSGGKRPGR